MVAVAAKKVGLGACPNSSCGMPVHFKRSGGGKLNYKCGYCDTSGYADEGGTGETAWLATIDKPAEPAPAADPPAPLKTKKASFNLDNL